MAGHTFIARVKAFFQRLFKRPAREAPAKGQKIPLHILDGVCCGLSPADLEVQDYLGRLVLKGEYKRPHSLESYELEEEERARFDADMKEARAKWERSREPGRRFYDALGYHPPSLYKDDDEEFSWSMERLEVIRKYRHQFV